MTQRKLGGTDYQLALKKGLAANINATATKALAVEGEPHYTTDTKQLYIFDGTENKEVITLPAASDSGFTGSFTNGDGDTVTVKNGIITDVS